jgi:hypothetical protein
VYRWPLIRRIGLNRGAGNCAREWKPQFDDLAAIAAHAAATRRCEIERRRSLAQALRRASQ